MSRNYDNWGRLVAAVLKKQQLWELAHLSRSPSICSEASDEFSPSSSFNSSFHDADVDVTIPSSSSWVASASIGHLLGQPSGGRRRHNFSHSRDYVLKTEPARILSKKCYSTARRLSKQ